MVLVAMSGWGVLGKHRFDDDARSFYKATRAITSHSEVEWPAATVVSVASSVILPLDLRWDFVPQLSQPVPIRERTRYSPSRSPPFA